METPSVKGHIPLACETFGLQVCIVVAAAAVSVPTAGWQVRQELDRLYEQRSLAIAESAADMPAIETLELVVRTLDDARSGLAAADVPAWRASAASRRAATWTTFAAWARPR